MLGIVRGGKPKRSRRAAVAFGGLVLGLVSLVCLLPGRGEAQGASASASASASATAGEAKNAIFMMGDGMGPAHRDAIQLASVGPYGRLAMDRLPVAGSVGTNAVESTDPETFVTDSAAGATAFATGVKTFNGAVGVDPDGNTLPTGRGPWLRVRD